MIKFATFLAFALLSMLCASAQITAPTRNYNVTSPVTNGPYVVDQILPCTYRLFSDVDSSSLKLQIVLKAVSTTAEDSAISPASKTGAGNAKAEPSAVAAPAAVASATGSSIPSSSSGTTVGAAAAGSGSGSNSTTQQQEDIIISENADVSKTEASAKHAGNMTYYEHSINFKIPQTVKPGKYNVVFKDKSTNTELEVPIEIRSAAAVNSPSTGTGGKASGGSLADGTSADGSKSIFAASAIKTTPCSSFSVSFFCVFIAAVTATFALV